MTKQELIEQLADKEHAGWSHWMDYLFSKCEPLPDGSMVIPFPLVERWRWQAATPYTDLSEREKQSDREQVAEILPFIAEYTEPFKQLLRDFDAYTSMVTPRSPCAKRLRERTRTLLGGSIDATNANPNPEPAC